ncbi:MAG: chromosome partitioning protein [Deltaproteobacteria bacterium]|nr:chromosome partitioning protein [Deltaproteobacteria bacterium]
MEVKRNKAFSIALEKQLLVFTGKGGVGKTAVSAASCLAAARTGKRTLLVEIRSPRRIPPMFGITPSNDGPLELRPGITWINLTPEIALQTYAMRKLKLRSVYRAVFEQRMVRRFLRAVPSLAEILILGHLTHLIENSDYDLTVLDAPSTGPGAQMLEAPRAVTESVSKGPLYDGAAWIQALLSDPSRTMINLVVLPEELPVTEAIDLFHKVRDVLNLPLGFSIANRTLIDPFPSVTNADFERVADFKLGRPLVQAALLFRSRLRLQEVYLDRLRAGVDLPVMILPEISKSSADLTVIDSLAVLMTNHFTNSSNELPQAG